MDVFFDDKLVENAFVDDATTVEEALRHVREKLCALDRLVIGLRCDGQEVAPDMMTRTLQEPAASFERLEVVTGTREELVTDAMAQASDCLAETGGACRQIADLLTEGNTTEAVKTLGECLRVWQQIHEAVGKSIEMLQIDAEHTMLGDEPLIQLIMKPKQVLLQVRDALKVQDYVLLADILQYEFSSVTDCWHKLIGKLRQEAENPSTTRPTEDE